MGKASELDSRLRDRPLQSGELHPVRPELQLREDAPEIFVDETTDMEANLAVLDSCPNGVVVRDSTGRAAAVMLSPAQYARLAGCAVESEGRFRTTLEHSLEPDPDALNELMIEQSEPSEEWKLGSRLSSQGHD